MKILGPAILVSIMPFFVQSSTYALYVPENPYSENVNAREVASIKVITSGGIYGTGVHIGKGYVLWPYHIYLGYRPDTFYFDDFQPNVDDQMATNLFCNPNLDFCLARINSEVIRDSYFDFIEISTKPPKVGDKGHLTGYPRDREDKTKPVKSECEILREDPKPTSPPGASFTLAQTFTTNCSAFFGSSNSPFINPAGVMTLYQDITERTLDKLQATVSDNEVRKNLNLHGTWGVPANKIAESIMNSEFVANLCFSGNRDSVYFCK